MKSKAFRSGLCSAKGEELMSRSETSAGAPPASSEREITELNARGLELLQCAVRSGDVRQPELVGGCPERWSQLDAAALARLAAVPLVLFDAGFDQAGRWAPIDVVRDGQGGIPHERCTSLFGVGEGSAFVRTVFAYAWHLSRARPLDCAVVFGMRASAASGLATLSLSEVDAIATTNPHWLQLRWHDDPGCWQRLLALASRTSAAPADELRLRTVQQLAGSMWCARLAAAG